MPRFPDIRSLFAGSERRANPLENPSIPISEGGLFLGLSEYQELPITPGSIIRIPAVEAAVSIISETIAGSPVNVMDMTDPEKPEIAEGHPVQDMLKTQISPLMGTMRFIETMTRAALVWGNAVARIERDGSGLPVELTFLNPARLRIKATPDGRSLQYIFRPSLQGISEIVYTPEEVVHLVGPSNNGYLGYNVADEFKEIWLHMLYAQRYGRSFFQNSARPSGILVGESAMNDAQRAQNQRAWEQAHGRNRQQGTAVLYNTQFQPIQTSPDEAQFLDTQRFGVYETARIFNLPVTKLRDNERSTYNNLLEESIDFVRETIEPWTRRWQEAFGLSILGEFRGKCYGLEFQLDHLTRRDQLERYQGYAIGLDKWITAEEIRTWEGLGELPQELVEKQEMAKEAAQKALEEPANGGPNERARFAGGVIC